MVKGQDRRSQDEKFFVDFSMQEWSVQPQE